MVLKSCSWHPMSTEVQCHELSANFTIFYNGIGIGVKSNNLIVIHASLSETWNEISWRFMTILRELRNTPQPDPTMVISAAQCCQSGTHNVWLQRIQAHLLQQALRDFQDVLGLGFWVFFLAQNLNVEDWRFSRISTFTGVQSHCDLNVHWLIEYTIQ